jgi:hypothetical protein
LKAPGTKRFNLKYDEPLSNFGFKFNLRRYTKVWARGGPPTKSGADEVMRSSASTLLSSGRVARFLDGPALDRPGLGPGPGAHRPISEHNKVAVPMMTQLSRRLEETRSALASELETTAALRLERMSAHDTVGRCRLTLSNPR